MYKISNTRHKAEWIIKNNRAAWCSNCTHYEDLYKKIDHYVLNLGCFCPKCGFKMKNPQCIKIKYFDLEMDKYDEHIFPFK